MNEPVSSPSLLTITAPSKEAPTKVPRAAPEDFRKQLSSHSKANENRTTATEKKDVKLEKSSNNTTTQKQVRPETEQEATSPGEAVPSTDPKEIAIESLENEEALEALAEELVVIDSIIATSVLEEKSASAEPLIAKTNEEISALTGKAADESAEKKAGLLEIEITSIDQKKGPTISEKPLDQQVVAKTKVPETVATSEESEQDSIVSSPNTSEEKSPSASATANDQSTGEKKDNKTRTQPSLLAEANDAAIKESDREQNEAKQPIKKLAPLSAAAAAVTTSEKLLTPDDSNPDTSEGTKQSISTLSGAEERANQRAELTAAAKTKINSAPAIDPSRFVSRVTKAFEAAQQQGGGPIRMRLSPPELGMLQVQIEVKEGVLTASLEAETHAARNLLLENLPALRDRLAEQQISIEKFDVDVRDESSGPDYEQADSHESNADTQSDRQDQQRTTTTETDNAQQANITSTTASSTISFDNDRVDLVA